jgi:hypothetical protein
MQIGQKNCWKVGMVLTWLAAFSFGVAACQHTPTVSPTPTVEETDLPFETISRGDYAGMTVSTPGMIVITDEDQLTQFEGQAKNDLIDQLKSIDYSRFFVIGVFRGLQASTRSGMIIQRVFQRGTKVIVQAQFFVPGPYPAIQVVTNPYHLIKLQKTTGIDRGTEFVLETQEVVPTP